MKIAMKKIFKTIGSVIYDIVCIFGCFLTGESVKEVFRDK